MARRLRYAVAVDEIMDRALSNLAYKKHTTKSTMMYNILKEDPELKVEMKKVHKNIYGTEGDENECEN